MLCGRTNQPLVIRRAVDKSTDHNINGRPPLGLHTESHARAESLSTCRRFRICRPVHTKVSGDISISAITTEPDQLGGVSTAIRRRRFHLNNVGGDAIRPAAVARRDARAAYQKVDSICSMRRQISHQQITAATRHRRMGWDCQRIQPTTTTTPSSFHRPGTATVVSATVRHPHPVIRLSIPPAQTSRHSRKTQMSHGGRQ